MMMVSFKSEEKSQLKNQNHKEEGTEVISHITRNNTMMMKVKVTLDHGKNKVNIKKTDLPTRKNHKVVTKKVATRVVMLARLLLLRRSMFQRKDNNEK